MFNRFRVTAYIAQMGAALRNDFGIHDADTFTRPSAGLRAFAALARRSGLQPLEAVFRLISTLHARPDLLVEFRDWSEDRYGVFHQRAAELCRQGRIRPSVYLMV